MTAVACADARGVDLRVRLPGTMLSLEISRAALLSIMMKKKENLFAQYQWSVHDTQRDARKRQEQQ